LYAEFFKKYNHRFYAIFEEVKKFKIYDPSFRGGVGFSHLELKEQAKMSNGAILKILLKSFFREETCGLQIRSDIGTYSDLFDVYDNVTRKLFEAGIIQHWLAETDKYLDPRYYEKPLLLTKVYLHEIYPKTHHKGAQILTVEDLEAGLVIYLGTVALSFIAFALEWLVRFKDYLIVLNLLAAYFKAKEINRCPDIKVRKLRDLNRDNFILDDPDVIEVVDGRQSRDSFEVLVDGLGYL
jgi:hypothetical protein